MSPQAISIGLDAGSISLEPTPVYLADHDLRRLVVSAPSRPQGNRVSVGTAKFFTVPSHLMEQLWLNEIPRVTAPCQQADETRASSGSTCIETVKFLIETADPEFVAPMRATFHVTPPQLLSVDDVWAAVWTRADGTPPRRCAWLNLDSQPHIARISLRSDAFDAVHSDDRAQLSILIPRGEGIIWSPAKLKITENSSNLPCTKLLVIGCD
jgi:hypothetical protein